MAERKMKGLGFRRPKTKAAEKHIEALVKQYVAEGMTEEEARKKAYKQARDNQRSDWRS